MTLIQFTSAGLIRPTAEEIKLALEDRVATRFEALYGEPIRRDAQSNFGQIIGALVGAVDEWMQGLQAAHSDFDPRAALEAALDAICAIHDIARKPPTYSTGTYIATGDDTVALVAGDVVSNQAAQNRYALTQDPVLGLATARATVQVVATGQVRSNGGGCYVALVGGTTGAGAGPSGTVVGTEETDGTVTWVYLGLGLAYVATPIQATAAGPVGGPAFSLSKIGTPRTGWRGGANLEDVLVGRLEESNEVLRIRRVVEMRGRARASVNAIRRAFSRRSDVLEVEVFENVEHFEVDGAPPHTTEVVLNGTISDEDAARVLFEHVAGGIKTHGTDATVPTADDGGTLHPIKLSRAADVDVYALITVVANRKTWPATIDPDSSPPVSVGQSLAKAAVLAFGSGLGMGYNVRSKRVGASVTAARIPGTLDVSVQLDVVPIVDQDPADVDIGRRQIGRLDSARTDVLVTFEDP